MDEKFFNNKFEKQLMQKVLDKAGELVATKAKNLLVEQIGHFTRLTDDINYKVMNNEVIIYTTNPISSYLEHGTEPHIIRPKTPGGVLKFRAREQFTDKKGNKRGMGDWVATKEVHHPGFDPRPFMMPALSMSKPKILKLFKDEFPNSAPTLALTTEMK